VDGGATRSPFKRSRGKTAPYQLSVATTHHDAVRFVTIRSVWCEQVFMITGSGVHDRVDWLFTITGIRKDRHLLLPEARLTCGPPHMAQSWGIEHTARDHLKPIW